MTINVCMVSDGRIGVWHVEALRNQPGVVPHTTVIGRSAQSIPGRPIGA